MNARATPFRLGLTGSIGMGKTTTAAMFADLGIDVWDADAAVHRLYAEGGPAGPLIAPLCPAAVDAAGRVDRQVLSAWIMEDTANLARLEAIVHPLVAADRARFIAEATSDIVLLDIPLLYETGLVHTVDAVAVVSVPAEVQRARVLERPGMTTQKFDAILARQMPNAEKAARADYVIETSTLEGARRTVEDIVKAIRAELHA
ncbi:dephospho-CoA kinase [Ovoidimarina sediminis]|uniref:dephospho-CoA kinase n=1 Tax=Ovoidimarina sediminis TaxID=3079856 RepID=UPI00290F2661|nr:dephospho-CoA kinase [Rhodophyticola sp. MJ-SS7]MDU8942531.1 dephospho-CoA kinase [Rhodophyticola sp. MJ-SS7]